ncbi:glycosyltransferase family 10 domain-containing protein [Roseimaritima sediminicola]|uniref:glycosyltransferase family 10 domain-containing protein n=1 Tax=Roseimaritima sediminicola TaxID=2662066 RepID=UPI00129832BD|nr:glycosyltransferase family 10 [Roseimaritima sediminicola]
MPRVLITTPFPSWPLLRQTPGHRGVWGDFQFVVNEPLERCDAWVVFEEVPEPLSTVCPPENTLFVSAEPPALRAYRGTFLDQFRWVLTCHDVKHRGKIAWQQGHPWHVGVDRDRDDRSTWDYDRIAADPADQKPSLISTVISTKEITAAHRARRRFVAMLKETLGDQFDVFGRGYLGIADKWDAVAPYRFHLVLENEQRPDYMTEKISDAFLAGAYPFYFGCPNAEQYFPGTAFTPIDIFRPQAAIETILADIAAERDRQRRADVLEARRRVLNEHNFFPLIARLLSERMSSSAPRRVQLLPRRHRCRLALRSVGRRWAA